MLQVNSSVVNALSTRSKVSSYFRPLLSWRLVCLSVRAAQRQANKLAILLVWRQCTWRMLHVTYVQVRLFMAGFWPPKLGLVEMIIVHVAQLRHGYIFWYFCLMFNIYLKRRLCVISWKLSITTTTTNLNTESQPIYIDSARAQPIPSKKALRIKILPDNGTLLTHASFR